MILTIQQRRFLEKVRTMHHSDTSLFINNYPVLTMSVLTRGEYTKHDQTYLNLVAQNYKNWVAGQKPQV